MSGTQEASAAPFATLISVIVPVIFDSDAALARAVGAPQSTVLGWRRGTRPSAKYVLKLSEVTGLPADFLLRAAEYTTKED